MSYQAQDGIWSSFTNYMGGGSGSTGEEKDVRPGTMTDFSRLKMRLKEDGIKKLGAIRVNTSTGGTYFQKYPKISYNEGLALIVYWRTVAQKTVELLGPGNVIDATVSYMQGDMHSKASKALSRFNVRAMGWMGRWLVPDPSTWTNPTELSPLASPPLWDDVLGNLAVDLDNATWSGFNIETPTERALWAVKESTAQLGKAVSKPFIWVLEAASGVWTLTKLVTYGSIIALGVWGVSTAMKRGKNA